MKKENKTIKTREPGENDKQNSEMMISIHVKTRELSIHPTHPFPRSSGHTQR